MKTMRHLIIYIAATIFLVACEADSYDKGEGTYSYLQADFVEAHTNRDKKVDYAITDNGDSLTLSEPISTPWSNTADSTYRVAMYYNKVDNDKIDAVMFEQMINMSITPIDSITEMKTDPVGLEAAWTDKRKRYINLTITLKVGTVTSNSLKHHITLIPDSIHTFTDSKKRTLHLTLYHDKGDIPEYYSQKYYFSLPTSYLKVLDSDSVAIHINTTANGMKTYTMPL
ncbi:MAG: hypothetical protein ACI4B3_02360 [Prevotella sp.]